MIVREEGIVQDISGGKAVIAMGGHDAARCGNCGVCSRGQGDAMFMEVDAPEGLKPGDRIQIEIDRPPASLGAALLFVLPLVALITGGVVGTLLSSRIESLQPYGEAPAVAMAVLFCALSFLVAKIVDLRLRRRGAYTPRIVRIADGGSPSPARPADGVVSYRFREEPSGGGWAALKRELSSVRGVEDVRVEPEALRVAVRFRRGLVKPEHIGEIIAVLGGNAAREE
jgi:positive regulator of sigma E activity